MTATKAQSIAKVDFFVAICFAASSLALMHLSNSAVADTIKRYGRNVDSGVFEWIASVLYAGPLAFLFGFASLALWRRWWIAPYAHWLAVAGVVALPFADYVIVF